MKTKQCANCGAPADNLIQCKYCKTVFFDETDNRLRNMAFYTSIISTSTCAPIYQCTAFVPEYLGNYYGRQ